MSILEQCISYTNGDLKKNKISQLLGIIEVTIVDDIIQHLHDNSIIGINDILKSSNIPDYSKLLDLLIERIFHISLSRSLIDNEFNLPNSFIDSQISPQDLQLWYSILMKSKEQMYNAVSKPDHLMMTLLRISLFTEYPNQIEPKENKNQSKKDTSKPNSKKKIEAIIKKKSSQSIVEMSRWKKTIDSFSLQGLMLDLASNSILDMKDDATILLIDKTKENTYPKKCITDFSILICSNFKTDHVLTIEYKENINTLYKKSVSDNIKSKNDMYDAIKDNNNLKEIESVFGAKIDKDNISKL
jgi:DNA polymerase III gamma/tau subunit